MIDATQPGLGPTAFAPVQQAPPEAAVEEPRHVTAIQLGFLVLAVAAVQFALALRNTAPWIVPDELIYSELAKSLGNGNLPALREHTTFGYGVVYPLLIAPAWALFDDVTNAYVAARAIGAVLVASAAVPAFLLARRFVASRSSALAVATFSALLPAGVYAGTLLTEVALYPIFLLALLAITVALERPTGRTQLPALAAIGLACATKMLSAVLVPAFVAGIVIMAFAPQRTPSARRAYLRAFAPTWVTLGAVVALVAVVAIATGSVQTLLGAYSGALEGVVLADVPRWFAAHLADLSIYVAVGPFIATIVVGALAMRRAAEPRERLFAAVTLPTIGFLVLAISWYFSHGEAVGAGYVLDDARVRERNMFYVAPLLLIALALWLERRRAQPRWLWVAAAAIAVLLPAALPLSELRHNASFQTMALVPWLVFEDYVLWPLGGILAAALLAVVFRWGSRRLLWGVLATWFAFVSLCAFGSFSATSPNGSATPRNWIDQAVGRDGQVDVLWRESQPTEFVRLEKRHQAVFLNEFFNRSVGTVHSIGARLPYGLPDEVARMRPDGVVVGAAGERLASRYVLTCGLRLRAPVAARDPGTNATLYRTRGQVEVAGTTWCMRKAAKT